MGNTIHAMFMTFIYFCYGDTVITMAEEIVRIFRIPICLDKGYGAEVLDAFFKLENPMKVVTYMQNFIKAHMKDTNKQLRKRRKREVLKAANFIRAAIAIEKALTPNAPNLNITELLYGELKPYYGYLAELEKGLATTAQKEINILQALGTNGNGIMELMDTELLWQNCGLGGPNKQNVQICCKPCYDQFNDSNEKKAGQSMPWREVKYEFYSIASSI